MSERDLADATEIISNRLYWVALHTAPRASPKVHFFSVDHEFIYEPFFADFGPLNLALVWRFCKLVEAKLSDASLADKRLIYYCSHDPKKRANAATLMCAFQVIVLGKTGEEAFKPFATVYPPFLPYRDATCGICTYGLTVLDCAKARLLAEKAHAALWHKFCSKGSGPLPVKLVAVELSEAGGFSDQYGVKEVPFCMMFLGGQQVYAKRIHGIRMAPRDAAGAKPKVLLVEENPAIQLKLERNLRRNGYGSDLAMDSSQAIRFASQPEGYGVLLISALLPLGTLQSVVQAIKRQQSAAVVLAFVGTLLLGEDLEQRKQFLEECNYVFPYNPSYTGLAAILARFDVTHVDKGLACVPCTSHKKDFLDDVLGVLEKGAASVGDKSST